MGGTEASQGWFSPQFKVAFVRAAYTAVVMGLIAGLTAYKQTSSGKASIIVGALAGLGILAGRGGVEGYIDTQRAA